MKKSSIAQEMYSYEIKCPDIAQIAVPGQFMHIKVDGFMLRRPISICRIDRKKGTLRFVFEIRGDGTKALSKLDEGDYIDIIAPLGKGFTTDTKAENIILVGGGIGTPPMLSLAEIYNDRSVAIIGFRNYKAIILENDFDELCSDVIVCTDDGSAGEKGFVTEPLEKRIPGADAVYACGPYAMLKKVAEICNKNNVFCEVSLEERMACGIGACLGCACRVRKDGTEQYLHVCKDGPVFNAKEVIW